MNKLKSLVYTLALSAGIAFADGDATITSLRPVSTPTNIEYRISGKYETNGVFKVMVSSNLVDWVEGKNILTNKYGKGMQFTVQEKSDTNSGYFGLKRVGN
jgi:hypothetical protein